MLLFRRQILVSQTTLLCLFGFFLRMFCQEKMLLMGFCFYAVVSGWLLFRVTAPLKRIIDAIKPIEEGEVPDPIEIDSEMLNGELGKLGKFLNALIDRVRKQISRAQEQRKESEGILHSLAEGIVAVDARGVITFVNGAACWMLQLPASEVLNRSFSSLEGHTNGLTRDCHELVQHVLQTSEMAEGTWNNGKKGPFHFRLTATPRIQHNGAILVIQDRTSDHKMVEMGKDFIANASHELRTPITIIRGFAETLEEHPNLSSATLQEIGSKITRTSVRLEKLIKSLLTLADIENVLPESFQSICPLALLEQCQRQFLHTHPYVSLHLVKDPFPISILADPLLLELAIMNLLENATRYSPHPAQITLSLHFEGTSALLRVKDAGIGIPPEDLPHIFDRFYTVDKARSRKSGGAGLGLAIVKTIVEKHSGKVHVVSEVDRGSTFTISVPIYRD